jgi:NADPH2:quinone reductase
VTLGYASGEIPRIPLNLVMLKGVTIAGFEMWNFVTNRPEDAARDRAEMHDLLAAGRLRPHVGARYPLAGTAAALRHVAERRALGKVVIDVAGG